MEYLSGGGSGVVKDVKDGQIVMGIQQKLKDFCEEMNKKEIDKEIIKELLPHKNLCF